MKYLLFFFVLAMVVMPLTLPDAAVAQSTPIPNPIKCDDINCLISQVIRYILGTIAIVATLMFIWGGFMMLTSGGNADRVKKAKETLAWAAIGLVVIMLSWAIIQFVLQGLLNSTNTSTKVTTPTGCCVGSVSCSFGPASSCTTTDFREGVSCPTPCP